MAPIDKKKAAHELPAWLVTLAWLITVFSGFAYFGAPFDPNALLDVHDWSEVATVVSGVFAPIAVLWVVRSFYVQKKELANAVEAANAQSAEFVTQSRLMRSQFWPWINVDVEFGVSAGSVGADGRMSIGDLWITVTFENVGQGAAHNVAIEIIGIVDKTPRWLMSPKVVYSLQANDKRTFHIPRRMFASDENPDELIVRAAGVDILRERHEFAFRRSPLHGWVSFENAQFEEIRAGLPLGELLAATAAELKA